MFRPHRLKSRCRPAFMLIWSSAPLLKPCSCGRIQFLAVVELCSLILCWLSAGGCSQFLEATHIPFHMALSIFKTSNRYSPLCPNKIPLTQSHSLERAQSLFKDSPDEARLTKDNLLFLKPYYTHSSGLQLKGGNHITTYTKG